MLNFWFQMKGVWHNLKDDVISFNTVLGAPLTNSIGGLLGPGGGSIVLDNDDHKYSRFNPARFVTPIPGVPVRIQDEQQNIFTGYTKTWKNEILSDSEKNIVRVFLFGPLAYRKRYHPRLSIGLDRAILNTHDLFRAIMQDVGVTIPESPLTTWNRVVADQLLETLSDSGISDIEAALDFVAKAELGYVVEKPGGSIELISHDHKYESRPIDIHYDEIERVELGDSEASIINDIVGATSNYVSAGSHDSRIKMLFSLPVEITVPPGGTQVVLPADTSDSITQAFVQSWVTPQRNRHYFTTSNIAPTFIYTRTSIQFNFANPGTESYVVRIDFLEGEPYRVTGEGTLRIPRRDEVSIRLYGEYPHTIPDNIMENDGEVGRLVQGILDIHSTPMFSMGFSVLYDGRLPKLLDLINVTNREIGAINHPFWVHMVNHEYHTTDASHRVRLWVVDASPTLGKSYPALGAPAPDPSIVHGVEVLTEVLNVRATAVTDTTLTITWDPPLIGTPVSYQIHYRRPNQEAANRTTIQADGAPVTLINLRGDSYIVSVTAFDNLGFSAESAEYNLPLRAIPLPGAPLLLQTGIDTVTIVQPPAEEGGESTGQELVLSGITSSGRHRSQTISLGSRRTSYTFTRYIGSGSERELAGRESGETFEVTGIGVARIGPTGRSAVLHLSTQTTGPGRTTTDVLNRTFYVNYSNYNARFQVSDLSFSSGPVMNQQITSYPVTIRFTPPSGRISSYLVDIFSYSSGRWNLLSSFSSASPIVYNPIDDYKHIMAVIRCFQSQGIIYGPPTFLYIGSVQAPTDAGITAPAAPTNVRADNILSDSMRIQWDAVAGATSYELRWREGDDEYVTRTGVTDTNYTITRLFENTIYEVGVRARNAGGASEYTRIGPRTANIAQAPGVPRDVVATGFDSSILLDWDRPITGGPATQYRWGWKLPSESTWSEGVTAHNITHRTITGLSTDTTYDLRVRAENATGNSSYVQISGSTLSPTLLTGVLNPTLLPFEGGIQVTWNTVVNATDYVLRYWTSGGRIQSVVVTGNQYRITGLQSVEYTVIMRARLNGQFQVQSPWSTEDKATPLEAPEPIDDLTVVSVAGTKSFSANWSKPPGQTPTSYQLEYRHSTSVAWVQRTVRPHRTTGNGSITVSNLALGTYSVRVRVRQPYVGTNSAVSTVSVSGLRPGAVQNVVSTAQSPTVIITDWDAPRITTDTEVPDYYEIQYRVQGAPGWTDAPDAPARFTNITLTGLARSTIYEIRVRAVNSGGVGPWVLSNLEGTDDD